MPDVALCLPMHRSDYRCIRAVYEICSWQSGTRWLDLDRGPSCRQREAFLEMPGSYQLHLSDHHQLDLYNQEYRVARPSSVPFDTRRSDSRSEAAIERLLEDWRLFQPTAFQQRRLLMETGALGSSCTCFASRHGAARTWSEASADTSSSLEACRSAWPDRRDSLSVSSSKRPTVAGIAGKYRPSITLNLQ